MRHWPPRIAGSAVLAAAVALGGAGCAAETENTFEVTLEAFGEVAPLPLKLIDRTGLVTGVETVVPDGLGPGVDDVASVPDQPDLLVVSWTGGMCDIEVEMLFQRTATGYQIVQNTEAGQGGCRLAGIGRSIVLRLRSPVDPGLVSLDYID